MRVDAATGYAHPAYAAAVAAPAAPLALPGCGGALVVHDVPHAPGRDAAGPYPLFACARWDALEHDLAALPRDLVSVVLVADPFGGHDAALLARCFPDRLVAFKQHFVRDLARDAAIAPHHRRNVRRASRAVEVEACGPSAALLDDWVRLYAGLVRRHAIRGQAAFSPASLAAQLAVPGLVALRARRGGETVGVTLWYEQEDVAHYHLGAYADAGYEHRAAYALFAAALDHFRGRVRWLALGAGAGVTGDEGDGLTRFKRGWSTGTRTAWLCGRVVDRAAYDALAARAGARGDFFPAYRAPAPGTA